ncbi:DUF6884 domain-containing protein [Thermococcus sp.]|uniref:DUF6884 domain-containing protein n=1 Tax=Thermococcus sp. TaxID=35749 RepID=UPI00261E3AC9|nr:DUF6884 domain-containing protein [Thermococcus sp.]
MDYSENARIIVITACGNKKNPQPGPAWRIYRSSRIKYLHKKSQELGYSFYILSGKYGLIPAEKHIEPYDEILSEEKIKKFLPHVIKILEHYDIVIYYQGGARSIYRSLIQTAALSLNKDIIVFGYANMGDINKIEMIINEAIEKWKEKKNIKQ